MFRKIVAVNSMLLLLSAVYFFIYPPVRAILSMRDPAIQGPGIPKVGWRLFRNLTPRYAVWAQERVAEGRAEGLSTRNISGTEWPLFGSVFYLWGVENLQAAWEAGDRMAHLEPRQFAKAAIIAASELVVDPKHAAWVKKHWGQDYLHRQNVFYRMLVIAALTTREKLLHDGAHNDLLQDQVESFARELDKSATGLLDDYPGECYPGDVMAAVMCIQRADEVLGTDHSRVVDRALRGFTDTKTTSQQLPPYAANSATGTPVSGARGCANSYMCLTAPELWPEQAAKWYALYDRFFWQERTTAMGYREFPRDTPHSEWTMDVDAGPVLAGYGFAANAFGIGAARRNGRFDRAYPLATEMLATVGELPSGVLSIPRLLSNLSDAPMLGEAAILWMLSIQPAKGFSAKFGGSIPAYVYIVLVGMLLLGVGVLWAALARLRKSRTLADSDVSMPKFQVVVWICSILGAVAAFQTRHALIGTAASVVAVLLPITRRQQRASGQVDTDGHLE